MLKFCLCKYFLPLPQRNNLALAHDPIEKPAPGQQSTSSKHAINHNVDAQNQRCSYGNGATDVQTYVRTYVRTVT